MPKQDCETDLHEGPRDPWWRGTRGEWYLVVQAGLFALVAFGPGSTARLPLWPESVASITRVVSIPLMLAGVTLAISGVFRLGDSLTALPYPRDCSRLVKTWPYSVVRHPIYSGLIVGALGVAFWRASWLSLLYAAILFAFFDIKSRTEERWLTEKYSDYPEYTTRVQKLIPWVY